MVEAQNNKYWKLSFQLVTWVSLLVSVWYIYQYVADNKEVNVSGFKLKHPNSILFLGLAAILMPINWLLESEKWKWMVNTAQSKQKINSLSSIKAVLSGNVMAIWTPNRLGEFIPRISFFPDIEKRVIITTSLFASYFVLQATFGLGLLALVWDFFQSDKFFWALVLALVFIFSNLISLYIHKLGVKYKHLAWMQYIASVTNQTFKQSIFYLLMSYARVCVYVFQFYLLVKSFSNVDNLEIILGLVKILCVQTLIPGNALSELGVKGASALWVFRSESNLAIEISFCSYGLWFLNLAIPTLLGGVFILLKKK